MAKVYCIKTKIYCPTHRFVSLCSPALSLTHSSIFSLCLSNLNFHRDPLVSPLSSLVSCLVSFSLSLSTSPSPTLSVKERSNRLLDQRAVKRFATGNIQNFHKYHEKREKTSAYSKGRRKRVEQRDWGNWWGVVRRSWYARARARLREL